MDNNDYEDTKREFSWLDYGLFLTMLTLSALIGVYFGFIKKQLTQNDYLLGGKQMSAAPVAMSLISSIISGVTILAIPTDIYHYGVNYYFCFPVIILGTIATCYICMPVFYELQITSAFEYLTERFDTSVRTFASLLYAIFSFLFLPIVIYIPALALSQATGMNIHSITPIICGVCIFYTTFGGLKAVVWTDALQFVIMAGALVVVFCLGISSVGGFEAVWQRNLMYKRLDTNFSLDFTVRDSFWTSSFGVAFNWLCSIMFNQGFVQKCVALPNYKTVKRAFLIFGIGLIIIIFISLSTGLIMFAKYYECDPLTAGRTSKPDQLLPYYIMDVARAVPGLPGIFTSGIFSAGLSTLSAVINSLSATIYEDFLSRYVDKGTSEKTISNYLKLLAVVIGIISTILVFIIPYMGNLLPLSASVNGIAGGTLFGIFASGLFLPTVNAKGVLWGGIISLVTMTWIITCSQYYKTAGIITYPTLPLMTHGCHNFTMINATVATNINDTTQQVVPFALYRISFYYYALMGMLIVLIVGLIVSKLTPQYNKPVEKKYFSPLVRHLIQDADSKPPAYNSLDLEEAKSMVHTEER